MTYIFYHKIENKLAPGAFNALLSCLPGSMQDRVLAFRNWHDQERCLAGKILLRKALAQIHPGHSLEEIRYTDKLRPYINAGPDFNLSHSGNYVVCAISETNRLGVDIEEIKNIPLEDLINNLKKDEADAIRSSTEKLRAFYWLWTRKEAFLKAVGEGLHLKETGISFDQNKIVWEDTTWLLREINIDEDYMVHMCINEPETKMIIQALTLDESLLPEPSPL